MAVVQEPEPEGETVEGFVIAENPAAMDWPIFQLRSEVKAED